MKLPILGMGYRYLIVGQRDPMETPESVANSVSYCLQTDGKASLVDIYRTSKKWRGQAGTYIEISLLHASLFGIERYSAP